MTDIENQANQRQNTIRPTGAPTKTQNINTEQDKKANKCCLPKPAIIAIVVVGVLLAILIPVILFTVVLKDDESAEENEQHQRLKSEQQQCVERNTKEADMMRRFDQINTNGDQNLSAEEHYQAFKDLDDRFSVAAF